MGEVVGCLIALPFVAFADWFGWINKQRYPELAKACHGAGMVALVADAIAHLGGLVGFTARFVAEPDNFLWVIPAGMTAWGLGWFVLNARYAALAVAHDRPTMIVRAALKIALGVLAWAYAGALGSMPGDQFMGGLLQIAAVWLLATGVTKLGLMLWGRKRGQAQQMVGDDIDRQKFSWDDEKSIR
jgi:fermentation-respiration switch protein FrsA (DUF1100 family)